MNPCIRSIARNNITPGIFSTALIIKRVWLLGTPEYSERNPPVTGGLPSQRARNAENVSIWWRHHVCTRYRYALYCCYYIMSSTWINVIHSSIFSDLFGWPKSLRWRHNGHDGVPNHQPSLFTQPFIQAQTKENIKAPRHWPVNSTHKGPVTRKIFPFDDVILYCPVSVQMAWRIYGYHQSTRTQPPWPPFPGMEISNIKAWDRLIFIINHINICTIR